ncbi:MAG TPA: hypothetical protein PKL08_16305 [Thermoanaerobaculaceae bacterium]|nr:hypothetical protein [Thermoanaerobaculaceae bacterium]
MARRRLDTTRADVVHMWLWWAVFETKRLTGSGVVSAFKAAQAAVVKLYP